jgi:hypothetical protein
MGEEARREVVGDLQQGLGQGGFTSALGLAGRERLGGSEGQAPA